MLLPTENVILKQSVTVEADYFLQVQEPGDRTWRLKENKRQ